MHPPDAEAAYRSLLDQLGRDRPGRPGMHLVGIHSGGAWVAERLHRDLGLETPLGFLSSAFHRDDYDRRRLPAAVKSSDLPFEVLGTDIVMVDDILFTGRTVRASLNEIFDYGRPARVSLAVLIDRGGRELPIAADWVGLSWPLDPESSFALDRSVDGQFVLSIES
jgi:pyrimidine operon attenuation protein/uracil phosphoribosyltransferase